MDTSVSFPVERIEKSKLESIDFNNLRFGVDFSDHMFIAEYRNGCWSEAKIMPYKNLAFAPAACVFHYGQAIFEGLKAHRASDGRILLFRPLENWKRMVSSAHRMCMAEVPENIFINGIKELVQLDQNWVPSGEGNSLYIRPFLIASDEFLGVKPSESYQFIVITSPTSNYYKGAIKVKIETKYSRAASGGIGAAKAAANYAASLLPAKEAQLKGYDQLIWTDANEHKYIEESGTMNLMLVKDGVLITPQLSSNTILPGITRNSVIQLARQWGLSVEEKKISVDELIHGLEDNSVQEVFGVGTAATITPIQVIGYNGNNYQLSNPDNWEFAVKAKDYLEKLKRGEIEDDFNWLVEVPTQR